VVLRQKSLLSKVLDGLGVIGGGDAGEGGEVDQDKARDVYASYYGNRRQR
jgi:hypothetical protein